MPFLRCCYLSRVALRHTSMFTCEGIGGATCGVCPQLSSGTRCPVLLGHSQSAGHCHAAQLCMPLLALVCSEHFHAQMGSGATSRQGPLLQHPTCSVHSLPNLKASHSALVQASSFGVRPFWGFLITSGPLWALLLHFFWLFFLSSRESWKQMCMAQHWPNLLTYVIS